jgi:hypothetical protein
MSKKFIISEKEKSRISKMHNQRILKERVGVKEQEVPQATTPPTAQPSPQAPVQQPTQPAPQPEQKVSTRYQTAVCPAGKVKCDQTVLRAQIRMNDECGLTVKLVEDGIKGDKTTEAWGICKPKLKPTKQTQGTETQGNTIAQGDQVKTGEPITANDIATLTA